MHNPFFEQILVLLSIINLEMFLEKTWLVQKIKIVIV